MKIAYCIHSLSNSGGMERVITAKANWLAGHGHSVTIITTEQNGLPNYFDLDPSVSTVDLGIGYTYIPACSALALARTFMAKKKLHKEKLSNYLLSHRHDIVISTFGNEASILPRIKDGSKKIAEIHFEKYYRLKENKGRIGRLIARLRTLQSDSIARKYEMFVTLTRQDMERWAGVKHITSIPNSVNIAGETSTLSAKRAIAVGRLSHLKGFDILIDTWAKIAPARPDWKLDIYGNGELRDFLQERINALGLQDCVTLRGNSQDIAKEYLSASLFMITSRCEGHPMALTEAMSFGLIPVSYDFRCGPRDLIAPGESGFIIPEGDLDGMARKVIEITGNIDAYRHIGINARHTIAHDFTTDAVMQRWLDLFYKLHGQPMR